jgi:uncharacterized protein YhaN
MASEKAKDLRKAASELRESATLVGFGGDHMRHGIMVDSANIMEDAADTIERMRSENAYEWEKGRRVGLSQGKEEREALARHNAELEEQLEEEVEYSEELQEQVEEASEITERLQDPQRLSDVIRTLAQIVDDMRMDCITYCITKNAPEDLTVGDCRQWMDKDISRRLKELGIEVD